MPGCCSLIFLATQHKHHLSLKIGPPDFKKKKAKSTMFQLSESQLVEQGDCSFDIVQN